MWTTVCTLLRSFLLYATVCLALENKTAIRGRTAKIQCLFDSHGDYQVTWKDPRNRTISINKNIRISDSKYSVVSEYPREWTLRIRDVHTSYNGIYTCIRATRPTPTIQTFRLQVQYPPTIELSPTPELNVYSGDTVTQTCNATGVPPPNITWYKVQRDGTEKEIQKGPVLVLRDIRQHEGGAYKCVADNSISPTATAIAKLNVWFAPTVQPLYQQVIQPVGKDTLLQCKVTSNPVTESYWLRGEQRIPVSDKKYRISLTDVNEGTKILGLFINGLTQADFGQYTCVAGNTLGIANATMVIIEAKPSDTTVLETPKTTSTLIGQQVHMNCSVASLSSGGKVIWWRDLPSGPAEQLFQSRGTQTAMRDRYSVTGHYNLVISSVVLTDAGTYRCEITGHANHSAALTVFDFASCDRNSTVTEGEIAQLPCKVNYAGPRVPLDVTWYHGNHPISSINYDQTGQIKRTISLSAHQRAAGNYTCTAQTQSKSLSTSCWQNLVIKDRGSPSNGALCDTKDNKDNFISMHMFGIVMGASMAGLLLLFFVVLFLVASCLRGAAQQQQKSKAVVQYERGKHNGETVRLTEPEGADGKVAHV